MNLRIREERGQREPHPPSDSEHLPACNMKSGARSHLRDVTDAEIKHRMWKHAEPRALGSPQHEVGGPLASFGSFTGSLLEPYDITHLLSAAAAELGRQNPEFAPPPPEAKLSRVYRRRAQQSYLEAAFSSARCYRMTRGRISYQGSP